MDWAGLKKSVGKPAGTPAAAVIPPVAKPPPEPAPAAAPTPTPTAKAVEEPAKAPVTSVPLDGAKIWRDLIPEIKSQRPLITAWVQAGRFLSMEGDTLHVGFPTDQKMVVESLGTPKNRKLLETLLSNIAGRPVGLKLDLRDDTDDGPPPREYDDEPPSESR